MSRWYRAYEGTVTDAKLAEAGAIAEVSRSVAIAAWHCLLESAACKNNCGGYETNPRRVALILCEPIDSITALFGAFDEVGLTQDSAVAKWKLRQHESDSSAERTRKWREKKQRETAECDGGDGDVTSRDAPETETETDSSEPKGSSQRPWARPEGVSEQVWSDLKENRKRKKLGFSGTAWKRFEADLTRIAAQTGIPPPHLIEECTARGWGAIYDPRNPRNEPTGKTAATFAKLDLSDEPF